MYQQCKTFGFMRFKYLQRKRKKWKTSPPPPPTMVSASETASRQTAYLYTLYVYTHALYIIWRSDWMAHSINIENENLKQRAVLRVRVKSVHVYIYRLGICVLPIRIL